MLNRKVRGRRSEISYKPKTGYGEEEKLFSAEDEDVNNSTGSVSESEGLPEIGRDIRGKRNIGKYSGTKSRIPAANVSSSTNNLLIPGNQFRTRNNPESSTSDLHGFANVSSFSDSSPSQVNRNQSKFYAAKKVTFFRNGDRYFRGVKFVITRQRYRSFNSLLEELSKAVPLPYGVRYVFSSDGDDITDITQFEDGHFYICSSGDQLIGNINYEEVTRNERRKGSDSSSALSNTQDLSNSKVKAVKSVPNHTLKPKVITIITGTENKKCKILLNRKTTRSFEHVLSDISEMLQLKDGPVKELYTLKGIKVSIINIRINLVLKLNRLVFLSLLSCVLSQLMFTSYYFRESLIKIVIFM